MPAARRSVGSAKRHVVTGLANNAPAMFIYGNPLGNISDTANGSPPPITEAKLVEWVTERAINGLGFAMVVEPRSISGYGDEPYGMPYVSPGGGLPSAYPRRIANDWYFASNTAAWGVTPNTRTWWQRCAELGVKMGVTTGLQPRWDPNHPLGIAGSWNTGWGDGDASAAAAVAAGPGTAAWTTAVNNALTAGWPLSDINDWAETLHLAGFTFVWFDVEGPDSNSSWTHPYPDMPGGQSQATSRLYVKLRAAQIEKIISTNMPGAEIMLYYDRSAYSINEAQQGLPGHPFENQMTDSFAAGLASGVSKYTQTDETFYRGMQGFDVETVAGYAHGARFNVNSRNSRLSSSTNTTDADRLTIMRNTNRAFFMWPTESGGGGGEGWSQSFADNIVPLLVQQSVLWSQGGRHFMYAQSFDDEPTTPHRNHNDYEGSWQTYLVPAVVLDSAPVVTISSPTSSPTYSTAASSVVVAGTSTTTRAFSRIEATRVAAGQPDQVVSAVLSWDDATSVMSWTMPSLSLNAGSNLITIRAYSINEAVGTATLTVDVSSYSYNFVGQANGAAWTGWTSVAGIVDVQSEKGRLQTAAAVYEVAGAYKNTANPANFEFTANATITTVTATEFYGVLGLRASTNTFTDVRQTSSWNLRFYGGNPGPQGVCELRTVNSSGVYSAVLDSGPDIDFVQGSVLRVKVRCIGLNIKVRYWKNSETEPSDWPIDYTAADAPTGTGMSLMIRNGNDVAADRWDWDDISIASLPPDPDPSGTLATTLGNVTSAAAPGDSGSFAAPAPAAISGMSATPFKDYDWASPAAVVWDGTDNWGSVMDFSIVNAAGNPINPNDTPNNERSASKPSNVTIESDATCSGGKFLRLATRREVWKTRPFSGVQMENFYSGPNPGVSGFKGYGQGAPFYVECRLRWTGYEGSWPGPWMYDLGGTNSEIDIMETPNTRQPYTSLHPYGWSQNVHIGASYAASNDGQWHRYGLRVDRTGVYRYFDNVHVSTMTNTIYASVFVDANMGFKFQHFCGGNWPDDDLGLPRGTTPRSNVAFPNYFDCDWLRIYR